MQSSTDSMKYKKSKILEIGYTKYAIQVIWITYKVKKIKIKSKT